MLLLPKENRIRDRVHRIWIASLPCLITTLEGLTQCAHVSYGRNSFAYKAGDDNCVPLCVDEHRKQTATTEEKYWAPYGGVEKVQTLGNMLYLCTGDTAEATYLMEKWRGN